MRAKQAYWTPRGWFDHGPVKMASKIVIRLRRAREVLAVIENLAGRGTTMVIVTHEIRFAEKVADQVLFVDGGRIVEAGTPAEVIGAPSNARTRQFLGRILDPG